MITKSNLFIVAIVIAVGLGGFFIFSRNKVKPELTPTYQKAPEFVLKDYEDREVKLSDFSGKNILVNSWAAWCPFCKEELKDFTALQKEFGDKIAIIAIDRAEPLEVAKKYSDELGVTSGLIFLLDPADSFYQSIGGFSMPETIFVDKEGFIVFHKRGPMSQEEIRRRVEQAFGL